MGIFSRLVHGAPLSPERVDDLHVDIAAPSLCGFGVGENRASVQKRLGPPRGWLNKRRGQLDYGHLGLAVRMSEGGLAGFDVMITTEAGDPWVPYAGLWLPGRASAAPTLATFAKVLGEPVRRDEDEALVSLFWERRALINADFGLDGELSALWVDYDDSLYASQT